MSMMHRLVSFDVRVRWRRGLKTSGRLSLWLLCTHMILFGAFGIPEIQASPGTGSPMEAMRTTVSDALGVLQDQELKKPERTEERVTRLKNIADSRFDYEEMAKRSLGGQWDKLGDREQREFVILFTEFLTNTYMEKIRDYAGEEVKFLNERLEGNYAEVKSFMVRKKTEIPLDYRLLLKGGEWKAYDVVVDGISLVRNYREQFAAILRSSSYEQLAQMLREKNMQYAAKFKSGEPRTSSR